MAESSGPLWFQDALMVFSPKGIKKYAPTTKNSKKLSNLTVGNTFKNPHSECSNNTTGCNSMRNIIGMAFLAFGVMTGNAYAAGTDTCPKVSEIKSSAFKSDDENIPDAFREGYKYIANVDGKTWTGVTIATNDDYLDKKYNLKAESFDGSICSYGGTKVVENGVTAVPYLKLKAS
ncbi:hypothetical protein [Pseudomonas sp. RT6P73]